METNKYGQFIPRKLLAISAHADDIDFCAGGSIAEWARQGAEVTYLILTDGGKGTENTDTSGPELAAIRQAEQRAAADTLGVKNVIFLTYEDGCLEITDKLKKDITRYIRQVQPDTVIAMDPTMVYAANTGYINHPDHRAAGQATLDAIYPLARNRLSFPDLLKEGLEPHKVDHVLCVNFEKHNFAVDITDTFELKLAALKQHISQGFEKNSKIHARLREIAVKNGQSVNCDMAECFMRIDIHI